MNAIDNFKAEAPKVMGWIIRDFHLTDDQAAGPLGNAFVESNGFTEMRQENCPPYHGGFGAWQWTGFGAGNNRAKLYLNWCSAHGFDWRSVEGSYSYLRHELQTDMAYIVSHLREANNYVEATEVFERLFERAGVPAMARRIEGAKIALDAYRAAQSHEEPIHVQV